LNAIITDLSEPPEVSVSVSTSNFKTLEKKFLFGRPLGISEVIHIASFMLIGKKIFISKLLVCNNQGLSRITITLDIHIYEMSNDFT
jgi:hypothetical protein